MGGGLPSQVFLSYAFRDRKIMTEMKVALERRGINVYVAEHHPQPGEQLSKKVQEAIEKSDALIAIVTRNQSSPSVNQEVGYATKTGVQIIPVIEKGAKVGVMLDGIEQMRFDKGTIVQVCEEVANYIVKMTNADSLEDSTRPPATERILQDYTKAEFTSLTRFEHRSPLELIKQIPKQDQVLPVMDKLTKIEYIPEQIEYAKLSRYADLYSNSWAEKELELIGFHVLKKLSRYMHRFDDMYDAGCANCAQYRALITLNGLVPDGAALNLSYYGQDFNPDWEPRFSTKNGKFFLMSLPQVDLTKKHTLVGSTHTLHYLEKNPIAIYTCFFSFNKLLKQDGYCYVTVPEKETQPGMLDLLERSAINAGFKIIESGKERLTHSLIWEPYNITTFWYLIVKKEREVDHLMWERLAGTSFFRAKYQELSEEYGITRDGDIEEDTILLEMDLKELLSERNPYLRILSGALNIVNEVLQSKMPTVEDCQKNVKHAIEQVHKFVVDKSSPDRKAHLESECAHYFYWLLAFYVSRYKGLDLKKIVFHIYPMIKQIVNGSQDIRVNIEDLTDEQIARLLRHLFELCQYENLDIGKAFQESNYSSLE